MKFERSFVLPIEVDKERSQAEYKDGVLTVTLAKKATELAKQLAVN